MSPAVPIAIFGWPFVVLVLFTILSPRQAVLTGMLGAWLFLPIAGYTLPGLPDITKMSITCVSIFVGAIFFDSARLLQMRWSSADWAMVAWIFAPLPSAISSGYGTYDGFSGVLNHVVSWGMPYLIGRVYFSDLEGLRSLGIGVFVGGLIYAPLVLFEAKMSPQLHTWIYGFHQHHFEQSKRMGGWRPVVFMQHGLAVGMFMSTSALCGIWMWAAGRLVSMKGVPAWALACGLFGVAAACRSTYALILMLAGLTALLVSRYFKTRTVLVMMLMIAPTYVAARTVGGWDAQELRDVAGLMGQDRQGSLATRLQSESVCWRWVQQRLLFGGGRLEAIMGRNQDGERFIPDGLWLIAMGKYGLFGLSAMLAVLLVPPALHLSRFSPRDLFGRELAGATVVATVLILYAMDNLQNAMVNPIYLLGAGGLIGLRAKGTLTQQRPMAGISMSTLRPAVAPE